MGTLWQTRRREILLGGAFLCILIGAFFLRAPERDMPVQASDLGIVHLAEVRAAHPSYERLAALRAEEAVLTRLLRDLPPLPEPAPPATDPVPFEDSVWQKNAQTIISTRVELEREQKQLAELYEKETRPAYEARRKAIDDEYLNAILNINLKIDNQRAMHSPQTPEEDLARERTAWESEREVLKMERGARQQDLYRQWQEEIHARVAAQIGPREAAWTKRAQEAVDAQKAEAERLRQEVAQRNAQEMARARAAQEGRSQAAERAARLAAVRAEADALEAEIMRDVRSRASKLALQHHLSLILASPTSEGMQLLSGEARSASPRYAPIIGTAALDLTAEMVREMQSIEPAPAR